MEVNADTVVEAGGDHVAADLAEGLVILHLADGIYYELNRVGSRVWALVQSPRRVGAVVATLLEEYEVDAEVCESEVVALITDLARHDLVRIANRPPD
ncbi:MAG: PqqD family protein [Ectothiorhodospiraceae bacterium]|nr:PqqD family protein [Chromatiales bacterium]MCP5153886.1 PqqD family protein [Ectothiorhodospiraceae bacterium]